METKSNKNSCICVRFPVSSNNTNNSYNNNTNKDTPCTPRKCTTSAWDILPKSNTNNTCNNKCTCNTYIRISFVLVCLPVFSFIIVRAGGGPEPVVLPIQNESDLAFMRSQISKLIEDNMANITSPRRASLSSYPPSPITSPRHPAPPSYPSSSAPPSPPHHYNYPTQHDLSPRNLSSPPKHSVPSLNPTPSSPPQNNEIQWVFPKPVMSK